MYFSAYLIDELLGIDGIVLSGFQDGLYNFFWLLDDKVFEIVEYGLINFTHESSYVIIRLTLKY